MVKNCPECDATLSPAAARCKCGHRFDDQAKSAQEIIRCAVCHITQEDYRRKWQWADGKGPKPGEQPYPYRTKLTGFMDKHYCFDHNPQIQHSLREFEKLEQLVAARHAKAKAA